MPIVKRSLKSIPRLVQPYPTPVEMAAKALVRGIERPLYRYESLVAGDERRRAEEVAA